MTDGIYTSAVNRLATLPEVFTGGELTVLFGWKSGIASSYLAQWRKAGLVQSLGGRSDVHMNLVRNRNPNRNAALRRACPHAVQVGVDLLREAGWTTQIPIKLEIAVPLSSPAYSLQGFEMSQRPDAWFVRVALGVQKVAQGIDRLGPAWALADMLARAQDKRVRKAWLLDPEDLDLECVRADKTVAHALRAFGLDAHCVDDVGYEALYSKFTATLDNVS
jgi:hypothetical protein